MGTTKTRGPSFLNKVSGALLGAIALAIVPINGAYADLVKYGYTNSAGVQTNTEPGTGFINPSTGISFMVSGGIGVWGAMEPKTNVSSESHRKGAFRSPAHPPGITL